MTTYTRDALVLQTLYNLGRAQAGNTPAAEDSTRVDALIEAVCDSLSARNIYTVGDYGTVGNQDGTIESQAFLSLADCLAFRAGGMFNQAGDQALAALCMQAENDLKTIAAPVSTNKELRVDRALPAGRRGWAYANWLNGS